MKSASLPGVLVAVAPISTEVHSDVLCDDEIQRAESFVSRRRRAEFLTARWVARSILADALSVEPRSLPPLLGPVPLRVGDHHVGLSHSNGLVAAAVSAEGRIALDIESEGPHMTRLAHRFAGASPGASAREATRAWTRWEALRKLQESPRTVVTWRLLGASGAHAVAVATT